MPAPQQALATASHPTPSPQTEPRSNVPPGAQLQACLRSMLFASDNFDTFFDSWGDLQNQRGKSADRANTLAVFLLQEGRTQQVCEYLMTEGDNNDLRRILLSSEKWPKYAVNNVLRRVAA
jgi:hypothetical protein